MAEFCSDSRDLTGHQFDPDKKPWPPGVQASPSPLFGQFVYEKNGVATPFKPGDWVMVDSNGIGCPCPAHMLDKFFECTEPE